MPMHLRNCRRGMTVDELLATVPSPSPIDKASSLNDDSIATKATHKSTEKSAAEIKLPALGDVLDLTRVAALSPVEIDALWNGYFSASERGGLSGSMDGTFYETLKTRASQCPFFLLPLPRPEGIEFFFAQFIIGETSRDPLIVILTPLKEYQLSGPSATPHLTLTHFQELLKSKDRVLMRGELGDQSALTLSEAQTLVYQLQLFYVTGGEKRWDLVQALHRHDSSKNEFNYQAIIDCMTDVPSARECKNSDANDANERSTSV